MEAENKWVAVSQQKCWVWVRQPSSLYLLLEIINVMIGTAVQSRVAVHRNKNNCASGMMRNLNTTVLSAADLFWRSGWDWGTCSSLCLKQNSSSEEYIFFLFLQLLGSKPSYLFFWLNDPCLPPHEQRPAVVALRLLRQVGFSPPAEIYALQCVLSTTTAVSSLSVKKQQCCAATLPSAG